MFYSVKQKGIACVISKICLPSKKSVFSNDVDITYYAKARMQRKAWDSIL